MGAPHPPDWSGFKEKKGGRTAGRKSRHLFQGVVRKREKWGYRCFSIEGRCGVKRFFLFFDGRNTNIRMAESVGASVWPEGSPWWGKESEWTQDQVGRQLQQQGSRFPLIASVGLEK